MEWVSIATSPRSHKSHLAYKRSTVDFFKPATYCTQKIQGLYHHLHDTPSSEKGVGENVGWLLGLYPKPL